MLLQDQSGTAVRRSAEPAASFLPAATACRTVIVILAAIIVRTSSSEGNTSAADSQNNYCQTPARLLRGSRLQQRNVFSEETRTVDSFCDFTSTILKQLLMLQQVKAESLAISFVRDTPDSERSRERM